MKNWLTVLLALLFVFNLAACGKETTVANEEIEVPESNVSKYIGTWAEPNIDWEMGGLVLDVFPENDQVKVHCSLTQSAPFSRVAEFSETIAEEDFEDSLVRIAYKDDGWGGSGVVEISFSDSYVFCDFSDVVDGELAQWGFYEQTYKLEKNDNAHELLVYDMEEYYEKYPIEEVQNEQIPVSYDTSKASGILAQMGMTMEDFINSCINLSTYKDVASGIIPADLLDYPGNYINMPFTYGHYSEWGISGVNVFYKTVSSDGYYCYEIRETITNPGFLIYDFRDDVYSPAISQNDNFKPYMIFKGLQTAKGTDYLVFHMLAAEKNM